MLRSNLSKNIEAGCDEAGRGCLAGPVVAAAVILPKKYRNNMLNDSKILPKNKREKLDNIIKKDCLAYSIGIATPNEIDNINILNASILAMHRAISKLKTIPELLLIDGNQFKAYTNIPHKCIVKGDSKFMNIAAASILAKTYRDAIMKKLDSNLPYYHWKENKGYPTIKHRNSIAKYGISKYHRKSFQLLKK